MDGLLTVLLRWLHIFPAALAIGGVFFMRILLPIGLSGLEESARHTVFLRCRRAFKLTVHPCILFLLISGVYNTMKNWGAYKANPALMHGLWGTHLLLALLVIGISLWALAGKEPPAAHRKAMAANLALLVVLVAVGGALKWARDRSMKDQRIQDRNITLPAGTPNGTVAAP